MTNEKAISVRNKEIDVADLPLIAEQLVVENDRRKENRKDLEKQWDEVDRQIAMEPELSHKLKPSGAKDPDLAWLPETELPLQAQTQETLVADGRRLIFPRDRDWFRARAALTEEYLQRFSNAETPIPKETGRFEGALNQDNADRLVQAALGHYHRQYNLPAHVDLINSEAYSYGFGVGRLWPVKKKILSHSMKGSPSMREVPVLLPRSARDVYFDDTQHAVMHEGFEIGPNTHLRQKKKLADLRAAAQSDDSFIKSQLALLEADKNGEVECVELEGDLVYETSRETVVIRDVLITAARGKGTKTTHGIIRQRPGRGNTYLKFDYNLENTHQVTGSSPLLKGAPVNRLAAQTMNRIIESGQLRNGPPLGYPRDDPYFAANGGPRVHPNAQWETTEEVNVYSEIGGDPAVLFQIFTGLVQLHGEVTGVNSTRLGAETKSHTTAFAKDIEDQRGTSRTVDYVNSTLDGPLQHFLEMEYRFALSNWRKDIVYVEAWDEFIELERDHLPDIVMLKALGANAPAEDAARNQAELAAFQFALQLDQLAVQFGKDPKLDHGKMIERVLRKGGIQDISEVTTEEQGEPAVGGALPGLVSEGVDI